MSWHICDLGPRLSGHARYVDIVFDSQAKAEAELCAMLKPYPPNSIWRIRIVVLETDVEAKAKDLRYSHERLRDELGIEAFRVWMRDSARKRRALLKSLREAAS